MFTQLCSGQECEHQCALLVAVMVSNSGERKSSLMIEWLRTFLVIPSVVGMERWLDLILACAFLNKFVYGSLTYIKKVVEFISVQLDVLSQRECRSEIRSQVLKNRHCQQSSLTSPQSRVRILILIAVKEMSFLSRGVMRSIFLEKCIPENRMMTGTEEDPANGPFRRIEQWPWWELLPPWFGREKWSWGKVVWVIGCGDIIHWNR